MIKDFITVTEQPTYVPNTYKYEVVCPFSNTEQRTTSIILKGDIDRSIDIIQNSATIQITEIENCTLSEGFALPFIIPMVTPTGGSKEGYASITYVKRSPLPTNHIGVTFYRNPGEFNIISSVTPLANNDTSVSFTTSNIVNFNRDSTGIFVPLTCSAYIHFTNGHMVRLLIKEEIL